MCSKRIPSFFFFFFFFVEANTCALNNNSEPLNWKVFSIFNPFIQNWLFCLISLDRSICNRRSARFFFLLFFFCCCFLWVFFKKNTLIYRNSCLLCKQCKLWSDAVLCGIWSGSTLFVNGLAKLGLFFKVQYQQNTNAKYFPSFYIFPRKWIDTSCELI